LTGGGEGFNGRFGGYLAVLRFRCRFDVTDPAQARGMTFSIAYRSGVVAYLNGVEIARAHMPAGAIGPDTPAEDYPPEAYGRRTKENAAALEALRTRRLDGVELPTKLLQKGVNVLAISIHRAPTAQSAFEGAQPLRESWLTAGVVEARLTAEAGVMSQAGRSEGIRVWTADVTEPVTDADDGDPLEPPRPIRIVGTRNGLFSGQAVVRSNRAIRELSASIGDLVRVGGGGRIPTSLISVRYPLSGSEGEWDSLLHPGLAGVRRFDGGLTEKPFVSVGTVEKSVRKGASRKPISSAVQPIWIQVKAPADVEAGEYEGTLSVRADGKTLPIPIRLTVVAWKLPDVKDWFTLVNLYQSPDGIALQYKLPLWSDRHFELTGESLRLIAGAGGKLVFVPLISKTNLGNEEGMVRWIKKGEGYEHDFTVMDRYLDLVERHMGKPGQLIFTVWETYAKGVGVHRDIPSSKKSDRGPIVSVLDPATGKVTDMDGPDYDAEEESQAFWKPVLDGVWKRVKKRGWSEALMLGHGGDWEISAKGLGVFKRILPECRWVRSSHAPGAYGMKDPNRSIIETPHGPVEVIYQENAWGRGGEAVQMGVSHDPECKRVLAHQGPAWTVFPRLVTFWLSDRTSLAKHRGMLENFLIVGRRGVGRLGADSWYLDEGEAKRGTKGTVGALSVRYPDANRGGAMNLYYAAVLGAGPDGPLATPRLELLREAAQECEARVFIERSLASGKLDGDLAKKAQDVLDERTRLLRVMHASLRGYEMWYPGSGWQERSMRLYGIAAEAMRR
jgi:hypothetical protein